MKKTKETDLNAKIFSELTKINLSNKELNTFVSKLIKPFAFIPFDKKDVKKILNKSKNYDLIEGLKIPSKLRKEAKGAIIFIIGGKELTIEEINNAGEKVCRTLNEEADVIWGARIDTNQKKTRTYILITK